MDKSSLCRECIARSRPLGYGRPASTAEVEVGWADSSGCDRLFLGERWHLWQRGASFRRTSSHCARIHAPHPHCLFSEPCSIGGQLFAIDGPREAFECDFDEEAYLAFAEDLATPA